MQQIAGEVSSSAVDCRRGEQQAIEQEYMGTDRQLRVHPCGWDGKAEGPQKAGSRPTSFTTSVRF